MDLAPSRAVRKGRGLRRLQILDVILEDFGAPEGDHDGASTSIVLVDPHEELHTERCVPDSRHVCELWVEWAEFACPRGHFLEVLAVCNPCEVEEGFRTRLVVSRDDRPTGRISRCYIPPQLEA